MAANRQESNRDAGSFSACILILPDKGNWLMREAAMVRWRSSSALRLCKSTEPGRFYVMSMALDCRAAAIEYQPRNSMGLDDLFRNPALRAIVPFAQQNSLQKEHDFRRMRHVRYETLR